MKQATLPLLDPSWAPWPGTASPLWPHQVVADRKIDEALALHRTTLYVAATGCGKTRSFTNQVRKRLAAGCRRALVLTHRKELTDQALSRLSHDCEENVTVEKANRFADDTSRIVVASVQTLMQEKRLQRFRPDEFGFVVADEAHHFTAAKFRKPLDYFKDAKVLMVTATPDRADGVKLGKIVDSVAWVYDIGDGIRDGVLCDVKVRSVVIEDVDLSHLKTVAGDFAPGELDAVMAAEKALHGVVAAALKYAGTRRTIVFTTSVANAHRMAEIFNRERPGCARAVDGKTPEDERERILGHAERPERGGHRWGEFQFLVNVDVCSEGYDDPLIACVVLGAPTKSRAKKAQRVGRGTRIADGKDDLLVLDVCGTLNPDDLVAVVDIFADSYDDDVVEAARDALAKGDARSVVQVLKDMDDAKKRRIAAELAARADAERRKKLRGAKVKERSHIFDPFAVLGVKPPAKHLRNYDSAASVRQVDALRKWKLDIPENVTSAQAHKLLGAAILRADQGLASYGQVKKLGEFNIDGRQMYFETARALLDEIARTTPWRRPSDARVAEIVAAAKEARP